MTLNEKLEQLAVEAAPLGRASGQVRWELAEKIRALAAGRASGERELWEAIDEAIGWLEDTHAQKGWGDPGARSILAKLKVARRAALAGDSHGEIRACDGRSLYGINLSATPYGPVGKLPGAPPLSSAPAGSPSTATARENLDMPPDGSPVGFRHDPERAHPCDFSCGGNWVCTRCGWESRDDHAAARHTCSPSTGADHA